MAYFNEIMFVKNTSYRVSGPDQEFRDSTTDSLFGGVKYGLDLDISNYGLPRTMIIVEVKKKKQQFSDEKAFRRECTEALIPHLEAMVADLKQALKDPKHRAVYGSVTSASGKAGA